MGETSIMSTASIVTVDGPSGAGKGTLCVELAQRLGWHLLDSGALYRLMALAQQQQRLGLDQERKLGLLAQGLNVQFVAQQKHEPVQVLLAGQDVTLALRTEECGERASKLAVIPAVRDGLLQLQHDFAKPPGLVADGRDMGTVVFPQAVVKVFLTASAQERGLRRYKQLKNKGLDVSLAGLVRAIEERDERDSSRSIAPLKPADDAIVLDGTNMTIDAVTTQVLNLIRQRL